MFVVSLTPALNLACSVFGIRTVEQPSYTVTQRDGSRELRRYPAMIVARTEVAGDFKESSNEAFRRLFRYINGGNDGGRKLAMTAPVQQAERRGSTDGQKIEMTGPVVQERQGKGWMMEFIMPAEQTWETLPRPLDPRVTLARVPSRQVAVVRFSGRVDEQDVSEKAEVLASWAVSRGFRELSDPRCARYDPPFTLPFLRRNEIHITVQ